MHCEAAISGVFFWRIFQIRIQASALACILWATFLKKKTSANQNVKMAAIFKMVAFLSIKIYVFE